MADPPERGPGQKVGKQEATIAAAARGLGDRDQKPAWLLLLQPPQATGRRPENTAREASLRE